jgi:transcriptional regulator of acetoin/glycerol metabolism
VTLRQATQADAAALCAVINPIIEKGGTTAYGSIFEPEDLVEEFITVDGHISCTIAEDRDHPFVAFTNKLPRGADSLLSDARWGTVYVDLATVGKVSRAFAARLFGGDTSALRLRPIISATSHIASQRAFEDLAQTQMLQLPPLAMRRDEVPRMFDVLMAEHGSLARIRDLGSARVQRLVEHDWPSNLDELREAERRIRALLEGGNKTQAAKRVGSSRQALDKFLRRLFRD